MADNSLLPGRSEPSGEELFDLIIAQMLHGGYFSDSGQPRCSLAHLRSLGLRWTPWKSAEAAGDHAMLSSPLFDDPMAPPTPYQKALQLLATRAHFRRELEVKLRQRR